MNDYKEFEVVGFDGPPTRKCDIVMPVIRHKESGRYAVLALETGKLTMAYGEEAIKEFESHGRLTLFTDRSLPLHPKGVIVNVAKNFLDPIGDIMRVLAYNQAFLAPPLLLDTFAVLYACEENAHKITNRWADLLIEKSVRLLRRYLVNQNDETLSIAEGLASDSLYAAFEPATVEKAYLYYAIALALSSAPERAITLFNHYIERQYPRWTWEKFAAYMQRIIDCLSFNARSQAEGATASRTRHVVNYRGKTRASGQVGSIHDESEMIIDDYDISRSAALYTSRLTPLQRSQLGVLDEERVTNVLRLEEAKKKRKSRD